MDKIFGDVHGLIDKYWKILSKLNPKEKSIQIGDFGFKREHDWFLNNVDYNKHKILFGNHDYYPYLNHDHSMGDYHYEQGIFYVRGGESIDKNFRRVGVDWFEEEEIRFRTWYNIMDYYEQVKPTVVVTHDAPKEIGAKLVNSPRKSITREGLSELLNIHEPDLWVFGHYHKSAIIEYGPITFICLDELEVLDLNEYF